MLPNQLAEQAPPPSVDALLCLQQGLGAEPYKLKWYVQAELVHARFAMLGVAGVLFPELISGIGLGGPAAATKWFDAGKFEYFAPASTLFIVQMLLFAWVEIRRCVFLTQTVHSSRVRSTLA